MAKIKRKEKESPIECFVLMVSEPQATPKRSFAPPSLSIKVKCEESPPPLPGSPSTSPLRVPVTPTSFFLGRNSHTESGQSFHLLLRLQRVVFLLEEVFSFSCA